MRLVATLRRVFLWAFAAAVMLLAGCGGGSGGGGGLPDPQIRFFNGSSDSVNLNFLLDDDVEAALLAYLESTPSFKTVDAQTRDLRIQEEGTSIDLWSEVVDLAKDKSYLVTAIGLENFGSENLKRIRFLFTELDRTAPNGTRARVVIIHGYNRAAGLDTPNIDFQTPGNNPQFKAADIPYGEVRFLEVNAGNETYEIRRAGTENILFTQNITLTGGKMYAAFVLGVEGQVGLAAPRIEFVEIETD